MNFLNLLNQGKKGIQFGLVVPIGIPKYVKGKFPILQLKVFAKDIHLVIRHIDGVDIGLMIIDIKAH